MPALWIVGCTINVCGSLMVNLAANLMKKSHNMQLKIDKGAADKGDYEGFCDCNRLSPICYWRIGAALFALGSVINFLSLGMAAQTLLAILGGVQFVSNIFFGRLILHEKVTFSAIFGTVFIIVGLGIAVSFSDHRNRRFSTADLIALYDDTYLTFLVCVVTVLILCEGLYVLFTNRETQQRQPLPYSKIVRPITYSIVSATIGTQSVLQSKCVAELLRTSVESDAPEDRVLHSGFFFVVCGLFLAGLSFWLYRLNNALKLFDGLVIIPIIQVFWTVSAVVQGGFYFHEFKSMSRVQGGFYFLGAAFVFSGVVCIASTATHTQSTPSPIPSAHNSGMMTLEVSTDMSNSSSSGINGTSSHAICIADETDALVGRSHGHGHGHGHCHNHSHSDDLESPDDSRSFAQQVVSARNPHHHNHNHNQSHSASSTSSSSHNHSLGDGAGTGRVYKERDAAEGGQGHCHSLGRHQQHHQQQQQQLSVQDIDSDVDAAGMVRVDLDSRHRVDGGGGGGGGGSSSGPFSPSKSSSASASASSSASTTACPHTPSIWDRLSSPFSSPFRAIHATTDSDVGYREQDREDCDDADDEDTMTGRNSSSTPQRGRDDATSRLLSSPPKK